MCVYVYVYIYICVCVWFVYYIKALWVKIKRYINLLCYVTSSSFWWILYIIDGYNNEQLSWKSYLSTCSFTESINSKQWNRSKHLPTKRKKSVETIENTSLNIAYDCDFKAEALKSKIIEVIIPHNTNRNIPRTHSTLLQNIQHPVKRNYIQQLHNI